MVKIGNVFERNKSRLINLWLKIAYRARIKNIKKEYEEFLKKAKENNIVLCNAVQMAKLLSTRKMPRKCIALIHDVDYDFGKNNIPKILDIERKHNVTSTFFIRVQKYQLDSLKKLPKQWEIGLHGEFKGDNRAEKAAEQKKILEEKIERKVVGVSMHKGNWEGERTIDAAEKAGFFYIVSIVKRKGGIITLPYSASDISPTQNLAYLNKVLGKNIPKKLVTAVNTHADYF